MKKNLGFSSFEFYFVMAVIGLILVVGIQRYFRLAEETQRLSFEVLAQNFNASVYNHRARWIMAQQSPEKRYQIAVENSVIQFSLQGWPVAVVVGDFKNEKVTITSCLSLWNAFLQNPPAISFPNGDSYGSRQYHLSVTPEGKCHYELVTPAPKGFYFEYSPFSGQVKTYTLPIAKNSE